MTIADTRYQVEITCTGVPEALQGVPLAFEVVAPDGTVRRGLLTPAEGGRTTQLVPRPGRYLVRTELPSREWVTETAIVAEPQPSQEAVTGEAKLDFGAAEPGLLESIRGREAPPSPPQLLFRHVVRPSLFQERADADTGNLGSSSEPPMLLERPGRRSLSMERADADTATPDPPEVALDYGLFRDWRVDPEVTLTIDRKGSSVISLPGDLALAEHPGWSPDTSEWRPVFVRAVLPAEKEGQPAQEALIVWPPSAGMQPLILEPMQDLGVNQLAPSMLARAPSGNKVADALFSYVRGGRLDVARQVAPTFAAQAEVFVEDKNRNPVQAILGAYTLQKVGGAEHPDWLANLANWFQHLPDGALLYGWYLIRAGRAPEATPFFRTALARGIPLYTMGVRLLVDGLSFLSGLEPADGDLKTYAAHAVRIATGVNPNSELTCLRLGAGMAVEMT